MRGCIIALALVVTTQSVRADDEVPPAPKSEDTAFWLSAGGEIAAFTALGVGARAAWKHQGWGDAFVTAGALALPFAPSFGEWYSGEIWTRGMTLRTLGFVSAGFAAAVALDNACIDEADLDCHPQNSSSQELEAGLAIAGVALFVAGSVDDITHARSTAREYNRAHRRHVVPVPVASSHSIGLGLAGSF